MRIAAGIGLCHNCDMLQLLVRVIKLDWLLGFTSGKKPPRRILQSLMYVSSCESLWPTWRGNELILGRQLLLGIFLQPWKINIVCLSPLFAILIRPKVMRFFPGDYESVCLDSGKKVPNYLMTGISHISVCRLVYPFFSWLGILSFLEVATLTGGILIPHQPCRQTFIHHPCCLVTWYDMIW